MKSNAFKTETYTLRAYTMPGALNGIAALITASLDNEMSLLNIRDFVREIIKGSILVAAVGLDMAGKRQS